MDDHLPLEYSLYKHNHVTQGLELEKGGFYAATLMSTQAQEALVSFRNTYA